MPPSPHLVRWQREYGDKGLQIVAVYRNGEDDTLDRVKALAREKQLEFPILFDSDRKNSDAYGIRGMPVAYLIDPGGATVWEGIMVNGKKEAKPELESAIKDQIGKLETINLQEDLGRKIDALMPNLNSDSIEERNAAQAELGRLAVSNSKAARPLLKARMASATDAEVRQALKDALGLLPALELKIEPGGEPKLGHPLLLEVRIQNVSDEERTAVRALDGSDAGARYPRMDIQIVGPDEKREEQALPARGNDLRSLSTDDFVKVAPGGEVDPFGSGGREHGVLKNWRPVRAGRYKVKITVDYTERNIGHWMGTAAMKDTHLDTLERLLSGVPKLKLEASIVINVKP